MKRFSSLLLTIVLLLGSTAFAAEETLEYGRFGKLTLYRNTAQPANVVLFVSGDGGWNPGVVDMARSLADLDALVVGINITQYLQELGKSTKKCSYPDSKVSDLPLVEVPAQGQATDMLAVILSGDGGWALIDREVGTSLAAKGVAVVGLNTLQYFWTDRSPDMAGKDLERIMRHYLTIWKRQRVLLIGYSLGADVLPFMAGRLPADLQQQVMAVALLAPSKTATFDFHLSDWLGGDSRQGLPLEPELVKLKRMRVLCLYGKEEQDSLCPTLVPENSQTRILPLSGGHHFDGDYEKLAKLIFTEATSR